MYINGVIHKDEMNAEHIIVEFSVDELMINNTPYTNFWLFCLLNDLLIPGSEEGRFNANIDSVILSLSQNEMKNEEIRKLFASMDISICI